MKDKLYKFKDPTDLTNLLILLLCAYLAITIIISISNFFEFNLLISIKSGAVINKDMADSTYARQLILMRAHLIILFVTAICYFLWVYRADNNALSFNPLGANFTLGWSIGWYFIPILNFWVPYLGMQEIWKVSRNPLVWKEERSSTLITWWWLFWVISNILFLASFKFTGKDVINAALFGYAYYFGQAVCCFILIFIVRNIDRIQINTHAQIGENNRELTSETKIDLNKTNELLKHISEKKDDVLPF